MFDLFALMVVFRGGVEVVFDGDEFAEVAGDFEGLAFIAPVAGACMMLSKVLINDTLAGGAYQGLWWIG